jgi:hypothetical protein
MPFRGLISLPEAVTFMQGELPSPTPHLLPSGTMEREFQTPLHKIKTLLREPSDVEIAYLTSKDNI